jgi:hypothetical protein
MLRDPEEITAHDFLDSVDGNEVYMWVMFAVYFVVLFTAFTTLTIFIIRRSARAWELRPQSFIALFHRWLAIFQGPYASRKILGAVWATWLMGTVMYTKVFSSVSLVMFLGVMEWTASFDVQGEDYAHVGQWGPLVAGALVMLATMANYVWPTINKCWSHRSRLLGGLVQG